MTQRHSIVGTPIPNMFPAQQPASTVMNPMTQQHGISASIPDGQEESQTEDEEQPHENPGAYYSQNGADHDGHMDDHADYDNAYNDRAFSQEVNFSSCTFFYVQVVC
jgi:hypothetical protein